MKSLTVLVAICCSYRQLGRENSVYGCPIFVIIMTTRLDSWMSTTEAEIQPACLFSFAYQASKSVSKLLTDIFAVKKLSRPPIFVWSINWSSGRNQLEKQVNLGLTFFFINKLIDTDWPKETPKEAINWLTSRRKVWVLIKLHRKQNKNQITKTNYYPSHYLSRGCSCSFFKANLISSVKINERNEDRGILKRKHNSLCEDWVT